MISVANNTEETKKSQNKKRAHLITDKSLHLIIFPTEQCNFRCTYCYEDFSIGKMSDEIILSTKKYIENRVQNKLRSLTISWFGGEPLVGKNAVLDISRYAMNLANIYPDVHYSSNMTTNAYLLNYSLAKNLADVGVRDYQVTLDGSPEIHNQSRLRADGKGTFETIWNNLLDIRNSSLPINIVLRLHFTVDTFKSMDSLIEDLKREFLPDPRFSFYFKAIERLGGANDNAIKIFSEQEKEENVKILEFKLFGDRMNSSQNGAFSDDYVCYASKPNSLIIRANGNIGKCTVALSDERNNIGSLLPDGTLKINPNRFAPWVRGVETLDIETLGCPLVNLPTS